MKTVLISKTKMRGASINSLELLQALRSRIIENDDAKVQVKTQLFDEHLRMVILCDKCNSLHLVCSKLDTEQYEFVRTHDKIYADHNYDGKSVTIGQLRRILAELRESHEITLLHVDDGNYTLTEVYKCSQDCTCIYLDCRYEENSVFPN